MKCHPPILALILAALLLTACHRVRQYDIRPPDAGPVYDLQQYLKWRLSF